MSKRLLRCTPDGSFLDIIFYHNVHKSTHSFLPTTLLSTRYNLAFICDCAFARIGSIFVAFITFPLIFNLPLINNCCAFVFPVTSLPKFSSLNDSVTSAFLPAGASPFETTPLSFRSMCQASSWPLVFLSLNAKMALPLLTASLRSASDEVRELFMASKAAEEGNASSDTR